MNADEVAQLPENGDGAAGETNGDAAPIDEVAVTDDLLASDAAQILGTDLDKS